MKKIAEYLKYNNIDSYYVGGYVRDSILGINSEDIDICLVSGLSFSEITPILEKIGKVTSVFGNFPIWIVEIEGVKYEFAMARKEKKIGDYRTDFQCEIKNVSIIEDLYRRDFTINAIAKNILTDELIDPFDGVLHIKQKILKNVSEAFKEDSLRVYRAGRFLAKLEYTPSQSLIDICKSMNPSDISNERVGKELQKLMKTAKKPSLFFYFLKDINWLNYHFKELYDLINIPQNPIHHPEGDAFVHTMHCIDVSSDSFIRTVMLCHDLGKSCSTQVVDGKVTSYGHEEAGVPLTRDLLQRISYDSHRNIRKIECLVKNHMIRVMYVKANKKKEGIVRRTLRELMNYDLSYETLAEVVRCDLSARPPKPIESHVDIGQDIAKIILDNNDMEPIVTGKILLREGFNLGRNMNTVIKRALMLQDRGSLKKENWKKILKKELYN